jgi:hypothetical protein
VTDFLADLFRRVVARLRMRSIGRLLTRDCVATRLGHPALCGGISIETAMLRHGLRVVALEGPHWHEIRGVGEKSHPTVTRACMPEMQLTCMCPPTLYGSRLT